MNPLPGPVLAFVGRRRGEGWLPVRDRHAFRVPYERLERGRFTGPRGWRGTVW